MANTPSTKIVCNADALSRAADAILARGDKPSKNAILNALAAAITGPGHDWGFVKNAKDGQVTQSGLDHDDDEDLTPEVSTITDGDVWIVQIDERDDWCRTPTAHGSKANALASIKAYKSYWMHKDHPVEGVMAKLESHEHYVFTDADDDDASPYAITIYKTQVERQNAVQPVAENTDVALLASTTEPSAHEIELLNNKCTTVIVNDQFNDRHQGLDFESIFDSEEDYQSFIANLGREFVEVPIAHLAKKCTVSASFNPQAWLRDMAFSIEPQGDTDWDIHPYELRADQHDQDYLKYSMNAPQWVRDHSGPFEVELTITTPHVD
jgi:hypothetical protein